MARDPKAEVESLTERIKQGKRDLPTDDQKALLTFADELALRKQETATTDN